MSATKDQAFVLKTQDYRDTSLLVYFYSRSHGKIHGIIKGVRDARYRYGSTVEPFRSMRSFFTSAAEAGTFIR